MKLKKYQVSFYILNSVNQTVKDLYFVNLEAVKHWYKMKVGKGKFEPFNLEIWDYETNSQKYYKPRFHSNKNTI